ncbi:hypothetical protein AB0O91_00215 [Kitasatospora sp. NPDC089797]|uniref:hypothetical protein n=1 Tax=Kitasatospora sp. NPDC089797 TaxID=3155298 RepID=UPI003435768B
MTSNPAAQEAGWAPARVSPDHLRALTTLGDRSVLIADRSGALTVVTPDQAAAACLAGTARLLATRADLLDAGLRESATAGRMVGPVVEVCELEASALNTVERSAA